jgi:hypothetical protein
MTRVIFREMSRADIRLTIQSSAGTPLAGAALVSLQWAGVTLAPQPARCRRYQGL